MLRLLSTKIDDTSTVTGRIHRDTKKSTSMYVRFFLYALMLNNHSAFVQQKVIILHLKLKKKFQRGIKVIQHSL